ncbi:MAG TPA: hypothetical protein VMS71_03135 [Candidatus Acidoferrum sp.]|nr:hypothetical protein [Candidatus Acidoferrum sp.]
MELGTIVAGILTLAILTFLYRDNPIYKMAEHLLVGVSVGYVLVITWSNTVMDLLIRPLFGEAQWPLILPLILGLLMFARFHHKTSYLSRIPLAAMIGSGAGVAIPAMLGPRVLTQVSDTVTPIIGSSGLPDLSALVVLVGLFCTLAYFYFSREHIGAFGRIAKTGTWFLMVFFGATFGYTVMSRMSTFIGRMEFLLTDLFHITN